MRSRRTLGLWRSGWIQLLNRLSGACRLDRAPKGMGVVADHGDVAQVEFGEEPRDHGGERCGGEVGVVGHRRGVRAERQLRDDAAVAIPQAADDGVPQGATHQHAVQQHHHRPVAAGVGTDAFALAEGL